MHTFKSDGVVFNYNGDYSGDVIVSVPDRDLVGENISVELPMEAMEAFVEDKWRGAIISRLEDISLCDLLSAMVSESRQKGVE